jgi:hypothetical protein
MRRTAACALAAIGTLTACEERSPQPPAVVAAPSPPSSSELAAEKFRAAWDRIDDELYIVITGDYWSGTTTFGADGQVSVEEVDPLIAGAASIVGELVEASTAEACAFSWVESYAGLEPFEQRPEDRLAFRDMERAFLAGHLLLADADRQWRRENTVACACDLASAVRLADHIADGKPRLWLLGVDAGLPALAMFERCHQDGQREFSTFDFGMMREAIGRLDASDPFGHRRAWERDSAARAAWIERVLREPDGANRIAAHFNSTGFDADRLLDSFDARELARIMVERLDPQPVESMSSEQIAARLESAEALRAMVIEHWDDENPSREFGVVDRRAGDDESQICTFVLGLYRHAWEENRGARERVERVRAIIE